MTPSDPPQSLATQNPVEASEAWPAHTVITEDDVIIAAVSLVRLAEICGTPCVHNDEAHPAHPHSEPSKGELASVVVAEVQSAEWRSDLRLHVTINADLSGCSTDLTETRLIGRRSGAYRASVVLECATPGAFGFATDLPADVSRGDLIVVPCQGISLLHTVKTS
ncbi:hypothetical protein EYE40_13690 [Glaciihabitans arcticus]|uniref:Uncharacterized protein n=1 Tax=Glaciihabitans arcticus TaxID=2668039 RepID=A0A4V2JFD5_9MICO|nr:hypothetical protein [Glaciihabitans arcticus]TBN58359.1 hypothetical protein EYE40_13690 [Glaciihabitans arcticus]